MKPAPSQLPSSPVCLRILLVDDNALGLTARQSVLEELGYLTVTVDEPSAAISRFENTQFDLVITDFKMPRMNGLEFIARIRELSPETPIILLSGFADTLGLDETNTGADAVIQKSANEITHLVRAVNRLTRRKLPRKPSGSLTPATPARKKA